MVLDKLRTLGNNLATVFKILLREAENVLCEVCKKAPGIDVIFWKQVLHCVVNEGNMDSKEEEKWVLKMFDPDEDDPNWREDLEDMECDFNCKLGSLSVPCEVPKY